MTDKPTPKEIDDLVYELRQAGKDDTYSLASAVLVKWGTLRADKIVIPTDTMEHEFQQHYRRGYEAGKKASTPQPTQVQPTQTQAGLLPLTHAQAKALVSKYANDPLQLVYQVEVAHGITGGQA